MAALRIGRLVFFAIPFVVLTFASASAFEVYNHTNKTLRVRGETCPGCFDVKIKPKHHKACPGGSHGCGERYISVLWSSYFPPVDDFGTKCRENLSAVTEGIYSPYFYFYFPKKVPAHGWASIFEAKHGEFRWLRGHIKDKHGKTIWKGPLKIKCDTYH